jgi:hypothetical protein
MDRKAIEQARQDKALVAIREVAVNVTFTKPESSRLVKIERGELTGTIAGAKVHNLVYSVRTWDDGSESLHLNPACGTTRHSRQGGHYVNYYQRLGGVVNCAKCSK